MAKGRLHFDGDNAGIEKEARIYSLTDDVERKINSIPNVIDNTSSTSATDALSANMGRDLQEQINNLASRGRYLTTWNAETGLPDTNPQVSPYVYRAGDYYLVSNVSSGTNYRPHGSSYTSGVASQTVEPEDLSVNDLYIYDGTQWVLQGGGGTHSIAWGSISGTLSNQVDLQNALDEKLNLGDNLVFNDTTTVLVGRGVHSPSGDSSGHWVTIDPKGEVFTHNVTTGGYNETTLGNGEIEILHSVSSTSTDYTVTIDHEKLTANDGINTQIYNFLGSNRIATLNDITAHTIPELHTNDVYYDLISTTPGTYKLVDSGKYLGYTHMIPSGVGYVTKPTGGNFTTGGNGILYFKGELDWTYIEGGTIIRSDMSQDGTGSNGYEFIRLAPMAGFSAPTGPYRGQLWYDTSADKLKVYNDSNNWVLVDTDEVVVSATAPSNPTLGLLWYDSTNNVLKAYDGTNWNACGGGSTYSAGNGISIDANNEISVDTTVVATQTDIANFFDKTSDDADDIDDTNSTNKFVTDTEKGTWNGKQDAIQDLSTIRSNAQAGAGAATTIATYGDIVTHDANEFATASQGGKADTAIQPGDNVSELTNDAGYITDAYHDSTKQDKLIAGANIQIAADGKTISATDTTYVAGDFDIKDLADSTGKRASWDAKQDAISDLATIRSNASTAIQPNDNISELTNDVGYITDAYHDSTKQDVISDLATIRSGAALGATALQSGDNVSELTNDSGYITNTVNDLVNYYKKTETYTQAEINALISNFGGFEVVSTLPVSDIKTNVIYLLGPTGTGADKYEEYIYYNSTWTKIGDTSADLTNYFNTSTQTSDAITQGSTNLFLTSAERTTLGNTSGTNTGDETTATIKTKLGAATSSSDGYLTSTDWSIFDGKQNKIYTVGTTAPSNPSVGDFWQDTTNNALRQRDGYGRDLVVTSDQYLGQYDHIFSADSNYNSSSNHIEVKTDEIYLGYMDFDSGQIEKTVTIDAMSTVDPQLKLEYRNDGQDIDRHATYLTDGIQTDAYDVNTHSFIQHNYTFDNTSTGIATLGDLSGKQDTLTAGTNIQIAQDGTISATDTTYTAGTGINIDANNVISNIQTSAEWGNITGTLSDQTDLNTALGGKQNTLVSGTNIKTINSNSLLGSGNLTLNDVKVSTTAPSSPTEGMVWYDTTNDVLKVYDGTNWNEVGSGSGDMLYADFNWASKTGATVTLDLNSTITPSANFTVNAPSTIKDGQMYVLRVTQGATAYTMTLGTNVTNPYGESLTMSANTINQFSFLAVGGNLELQPSVTVGESGTKIFYANTGDTGHEISDIGEELETWLNATGQTDDYDTFKDAVLVYDGVTYNRRNTFYTDSGYKYIYFISRSPNVQNNNNGTSKGYYSLIRFKFSYSSGWSYESDYSTSYVTTTTQNFLRADYNYPTPYTPLYNGSPATKKYVDDGIASITTQRIWMPDTTKTVFIHDTPDQSELANLATAMEDMSLFLNGLIIDVEDTNNVHKTYVYRGLFNGVYTFESTEEFIDNGYLKVSTVNFMYSSGTVYSFSISSANISTVPPTYTAGSGISISNQDVVSASIYPSSQTGAASTVKIWVGTQSDYNSLASYDSGTLYFTTSS